MKKPAKRKPLRGFISARVSTDEQNKPGLPSIPNQIEQCRQVAERLGVPVNEVDVLIDDETGQIVDRPGLTVALAQIDQYSHGFFYDATRLARRRKVALTIRDALKEAGVELRLVLGDTAEMDAESRLWMESIQDAASEAEVLRFVRRSRTGRRGRAQRGLHTGHVPYGYRVIRDVATGRVTGYELDYDAELVLMRMARLFTQRRPYVEIGQVVGMRDSTVRRIFENPWYRGLAFYARASLKGDEAVYAKGDHPLPWDAETLALIDAELARRKQQGMSQPRRRNQVYGLFSGILHCGYCGRLLTASSRVFRTLYKGYGCPRRNYIRQGRMTGELHPPVYISERKVLDQLRKLFASVTVEGLDRLLAGLKPRSTAGAGPLPGLLARLDQLDAQIAELETALPTLTGATHRAVKEEYDRARDERQRLALETGPARPAGQVDVSRLRQGMLAFVEHPEWFDLPEVELRPRLVEAVPELYIRGGKIIQPPEEFSV